LRRPGAARFRAIDTRLDGTGRGHWRPVLRARATLPELPAWPATRPYPNDSPGSQENRLRRLAIR
jgi:hypothetical protein